MRDCYWAAKHEDSVNIQVSPRKRCSPCAPASRVYLIGAFGGCAEAVIEALRGNKPAALTLDYQVAESVSGAAIELYNSQLRPAASRSTTKR